MESRDGREEASRTRQTKDGATENEAGERFHSQAQFAVPETPIQLGVAMLYA